MQSIMLLTPALRIREGLAYSGSSSLRPGHWSSSADPECRSGTLLSLASLNVTNPDNPPASFKVPARSSENVCMSSDTILQAFGDLQTSAEGLREVDELTAFLLSSDLPLELEAIPVDKAPTCRVVQHHGCIPPDVVHNSRAPRRTDPCSPGPAQVGLPCLHRYHHDKVPHYGRQVLCKCC